MTYTREFNNINNLERYIFFNRDANKYIRLILLHAVVVTIIIRDRVKRIARCNNCIQNMGKNCQTSKKFALLKLKKKNDIFLNYAKIINIFKVR